MGIEDELEYKSLHSGWLRAWLELVRQPALAAVLAVIVEGHLGMPMRESPNVIEMLTKIPAPHSVVGHSRRRRLILPSESTL